MGGANCDGMKRDELIPMTWHGEFMFMSWTEHESMSKEYILVPRGYICSLV